MRRRNRRIKKNSRFVTSSMGIASLIVSGFIMMMIFFAVNSRCAAITRDIGQKEKELKRLSEELAREKARWNDMKTTDKLKRALVKFGLEMNTPREDQIVRIGKNGVPVPGQLALAHLRGTSASPKSVVAHAQPRKAARVGITTPTRRRGRNGVLK
jgi:hypothetical protein